VPRSRKTWKSIVFIVLLAGLVALVFQMIRMPQDVVATPKAPTLTFKGGSGDTPATAVIIQGAPDYLAVVEGEYQYLAKEFGRRNRDWRVVKKEVYQHDAQVYDVITVEFPNEVRQQVFFDISKYFKKP
jgi:hypothetical protein